MPAWQVPRMTKTSASARSATSRYAQAYAGPPRRKAMGGASTARTGGVPAGRASGGAGGPAGPAPAPAPAGAPPRRKALALEEAVRVERFGDGLDLLARE